MTDIWISNNKPYDHNSTTMKYYYITYLLIPLCFLLIAHSYYKHRLKFHIVRICCDVVSIIGLFWSTFLIISFHNSNIMKTAILRNFFCYGIFQYIVVFCDHYMFYKTYSVLIKIPKWQTNLIFTYIWIILIFARELKWNLVPFFSNPTSIIYINSYYYLDLISYYGAVLFDIFFTIVFTKKLIKNYSSSYIMNSRIKSRTILLITNGIGHCITSSFSHLYRVLDNDELASFEIWMFITVITLNIWFNIKFVSWIINNIHSLNTKSSILQSSSKYNMHIKSSNTKSALMKSNSVRIRKKVHLKE